MIEFAAQAPSKEIFLQSWVGAGILVEWPGANYLDPVLGAHRFTADYDGCVQVTDFDFGGQIPGKAGYFVNARVSGHIERAMIAGKVQTDGNGVLFDVMERTWAPLVFGLTFHERDPVTNFPAGWRSGSGVTYTDVRNLISPFNVWL